jgi:hypothetical protein
VYVLAAFVSFFNAFAGLAVCLSLWFLWPLLYYRPHDHAT